MPSNQTTLMCDIVPLWTGYMWGTLPGSYDVCSIFLLTVPPFFALYFGILYLQTTLEENNNFIER